MGIFNKNKPYHILDGYEKLSDVYTEGPFGHHENATADEKEEYFMQWVYPIKLNRIALRTAAGFRFVYLYAKDLWNNKIAIKIPDKKEKSQKVTYDLITHLRKLHWFREMEKLSAYEREQGESILMNYYDDQGGIEKYKNPIPKNKPILRVEAFSPLHYHIEGFDKYGKPKMYKIEVKSGGNWRNIKSVYVHPSRVLRKCANEIEYRFTGYSDLAAIADPIIVLSTILKACGEAAFRWGTGHPVFFTKDLVNPTDMQKLKTSLGDVTRRHWHVVPIEQVEKIEMLGQAGSMLNLKSLADICIEQIVIGSAFPKPILLGEIAGVLGSEVSERSYFAKLDRDHTDLEPFIYEFFDIDINVRRILKGIKNWSIDWGIREVFNKMDQAEYDQKMASIAIAMMEYATVNEVRRFANLPEISEEEGGKLIRGLMGYYEMEMNAMIMEQEAELHAEAEGATSMREKSNSTNKKAASLKDPEKNKRIDPVSRDSITANLKNKFKDAILGLKKEYGTNKISKEIKIYDKTLEKLLKWANSPTN